MRVLQAPLAALLMPSVSAPALAQTTGPGWSMPMHEWYWWWGAWHMLIPIIFVGLLVAGVIVLVRWLWPEDSRLPHGGGNRALEVLDERYAKGEIEREDYLRRREDLQRQRA